MTRIQLEYLLQSQDMRRQSIGRLLVEDLGRDGASAQGRIDALQHDLFTGSHSESISKVNRETFHDDAIVTALF